MFTRVAKVVAAVLIAFVVMKMSTATHGDRHLYPAGNEKVTVYLLDNGFHTDIAVPAALVKAHGGPLDLAAPRQSGRWVSYGWGELGFYTAKGFPPRVRPTACAPCSGPAIRRLFSC